MFTRPGSQLTVMTRWSALSSRLFSTATSSTSSSGIGNNLKIFSLIPKHEKVPSGAFRLSDGTVHRGSLAIIGANRYNWDPKEAKNIEKSVSVLLEVIRPIPDIVIIGIEKMEPKTVVDLSRYGCSVEISDIVS